jgi:hypothetical protein
LVPYNTSFVPDFYGFTFNDTNPYGVPDWALPLQYPNLATVAPSSEDAGLTDSFGIWSYHDNMQHPSVYTSGFGPYIGGKKLAKGDYRALLRVLRWDADWEDEKGYQSWLSPVIRAKLP